MKINNGNVGNNSAVQSTATTRTRDVKGDTKAGKTPVSAEMLAGSSKVDVSAHAQMMGKAKAIAKNDSIDEAKVARIQKLIDDGNYKTDAAAIADKLIDEHLLMGE